MGVLTTITKSAQGVMTDVPRSSPPSAGTTGSPIGLLLALTYAVGSAVMTDIIKSAQGTLTTLIKH